MFRGFPLDTVPFSSVMMPAKASFDRYLLVDIYRISLIVDGHPQLACLYKLRSFESSRNDCLSWQYFMFALVVISKSSGSDFYFSYL